MKREVISILLSSLLWAQCGISAKAAAPEASPRPQARDSEQETLKERVLEIPAGTMVEVRLTNREKLRGRLGEISDDGFNLQTAKRDKIETRKIAFDELKSVKKVEGNKGAQTAGYIVLGGLAGVGVLFLILLASLG
jgi:hypothetical protein